MNVAPRSRRQLALLAMGVALLATLVLALGASDALARPGGGQSYSGGSSRSSSGSSSSGGSSDGGGILNLIIWLVIEVPALGIPLLIIFIGYVAYTRFRGERKEWSTTTPQEAPTMARRSARKELEGLRREDPNFSIVLFEDFVTFLYGQVHEARGRGAVDELGPYLSDTMRASLQRPPRLQQVKGIVIGAMRIRHAELGAAQSVVVVEVEANMTEVYDQNAEQAYYVVERWTLVRRRGARSREPSQSRTLGCPNCGAPRTQLRGNRCFQCGTAVGDGAFDWTVSGLSLVARENRPPLLTGDVEEKGTNLPTIVDPEAQSGFAGIQAKDPQVSWNAFTARVAMAFQQLQVAWSSQNLALARPYLSDTQFQSMTYWVSTYQRSRLRNVTENASITSILLARVTSDRFYDAVTIRLVANGLDYTLDESGRVVAGSKSRMRPYTEYWTLIRGSARKGAPRAEPVCPNCGAPLNVNMAGTCGYCNVIVTTGEFDWVISRIEQDEAYEG